MGLYRGYDPNEDEKLFKVFVYDKDTFETIDSNILTEEEIDGFLTPLLKKYPNAAWGVDEY